MRFEVLYTYHNHVTCTALSGCPPEKGPRVSLYQVLSARATWGPCGLFVVLCRRTAARPFAQQSLKRRGLHQTQERNKTAGAMRAL